MNIAILTQYYKPEIGAPQNRLYEMASGLKKLGANVSIITSMPNYPTGRVFDAYRNKFSLMETIDSIDVKRYWIYASNSKRVIPRVFSMFSFSLTALFSLKYLRKNKFDLIIVESPPLTLGLSAYFLARRSKAKFVMNVSDLWPLSAKEMGAISDGMIYSCLEKIEKFLYKKALFCMGQSQEIVDYIKNNSDSETYLFRNGVDPSRFTEINNKTKDNGSLIITYAGLLGYAQGILDICKNIDFRSVNAEFHIYGAGGEQAEIESYLKNNPDKGIFFHGKVDREQIPYVLSSSDITLVPLVKKIFGAVPSKIYESMAAGVPILFSGEGEGQLIIEEYDLGWVLPAKDYEALRDKILYLQSNRAEIEQKQDKCYYAARNLFNRPKQIEGLYKFILEKVEKTSPENTKI